MVKGKNHHARISALCTAAFLCASFLMNVHPAAADELPETTADPAYTAEAVSGISAPEGSDHGKTLSDLEKIGESIVQIPSEDVISAQESSDKTYTVSDTVQAVLEDGVLTVSGSGSIPDWDIYDGMIPPWLDDADEIVSVSAEEGITGIGMESFSYCANLESVVIAGSVSEIGEGAFYSCPSLSSLTLNEGITRICPYAFFECSALRTVTVPKSVSIIEESAFSAGTEVVPLDKSLKKFQEFGEDYYTKADTFSITGSEDYAMAYEVLELANKQRRSAGLPEMKMDGVLLEEAMQRAAECSVLFGHMRPYFTNALGIDFDAAGENIALGQSTASGVMNAWMKSDDPKGNILRSNYISTGIGCVRIGGVYHWTQIFSGKSTSSNYPRPANKNQTFTLNLGTGSVTLKNKTVSYEYSGSLEKTTISAGENSGADLSVRRLGLDDAATVTFDRASVRWASSNPVAATISKAGIIKGLMTGKTSEITGASDTGSVKMSKQVTVLFSDVKDSAKYYFTPVYWAVENGITSGTTLTTFSPANTCSRAQVVTFLWKKAGSPEPSSHSNPFRDVSAGAYYYKAVLWAVENGITSGISKNEFGPKKGCTSAHVVTFLWKSEGSQEISRNTGFTDVRPDAYYAKAVQWAAARAITGGTSKTTFSPDSVCTRAQIVTFLYRT